MSNIQTMIVDGEMCGFVVDATIGDNEVKLILSTRTNNDFLMWGADIESITSEAYETGFYEHLPKIKKFFTWRFYGYYLFEYRLDNALDRIFEYARRIDLKSYDKEGIGGLL